MSIYEPSLEPDDDRSEAPECVGCGERAWTFDQAEDMSNEDGLCGDCAELPQVTFCNSCNATPDEVNIWEAAHAGHGYPEARTTVLEHCDECAPVAAVWACIDAIAARSVAS